MREGADELTLRRDARMLRTCIDTTNVGDSGREPLVHQDWYRGVEGPELENLYQKYAELHEAVNLKKTGISEERAKALWSMRDSTAHGEAYYDRSGER